MSRYHNRVDPEFVPFLPLSEQRSSMGRGPKRHLCVAGDVNPMAILIFDAVDPFLEELLRCLVDCPIKCLPAGCKLDLLGVDGSSIHVVHTTQDSSLRPLEIVLDRLLQDPDFLIIDPEKGGLLSRWSIQSFLRGTFGESYTGLFLFKKLLNPIPDSCKHVLPVLVTLSNRPVYCSSYFRTYLPNDFPIFFLIPTEVAKLCPLPHLPAESLFFLLCFVPG